MRLPVESYVGIPYAPRGRTRSGVDCWGLVGLVYAEQFGVRLPGGPAEYAPGDGAQVMALFEGPPRDEWVEIDTPHAGDVVLCRVLGYASHVGVLCEPGAMLHAREGHAVVVERIDRGAWRHRVAGFFRHTSQDVQTGVQLSGRPHPLRTTTLQGIVPEGATLLEMVRVECTRAGVPAELVSAQGHAWVEGEYIAAAEWGSYRPHRGQRVEYRLLAAGGGDTLRTVLTLALIVAAIAFQQYYLMPALTEAGFVTAAGALTMGGAALYAAGTAAFLFAGAMLINAIAPIRLPDAPDSTAIKRKNRLQGGPNTGVQFGALPVVLGQHRFTPPSAAVSYVEAEGGESYLRMAVCWGYGPLDVSDVRIGDTPLSEYEEVEQAHLVGRAGESRTDFNRLYGQDVAQEQINIKLASEVDVTRTVSSDVDMLRLNFHFPMGLWKTPLSGENAGNVDPVTVKAKVEYRQVGAAYWNEAAQVIPAKTLTLGAAYEVVDATITPGATSDIATWWLTQYGGTKVNVGEHVYIEVYRWALLSLDKRNNLVVRYGCETNNQYGAPSARLRRLMEENSSGLITTYERLPTPGDAEELLYRVCIKGAAIVVIEDLRDESITGCAAADTTAGDVPSLSLASGTIARADSETLVESRATKEAFDAVVNFAVPNGQYDVRVRLKSNDYETGDRTNGGAYPSGNKAGYYRDCYWTTLTGVANQRPIAPPVPLCMTSYRIRASNQLNGSVDGITGTVKSLCLDYDKTGDTWVERHTRNPAALLRYVLQHPGSARPVADAGIDLVTLKRWHNYCRVQGFAFDAVLIQQRPLLDVLRDIAAAGRASPTLIDGQWSVVIDEPKTMLVQHFTPHNSWGFSGTRALPRMPHGLRIRFYNRARGYQLDERVVYDDGYSSSNATLIEAIELPGVTEEASVHAFGRFHIAQMRLRPDTYTLNVDAEHLICTRGDLVRVTHDVPMWGLGSGRITAIQTSGSDAIGVTLDEALPMVASGSSYALRIRRSTGDTLVRALDNPVSDGEYNTVVFTTPTASSNLSDGDLCLFGLLDSESVRLLVQAVEPLPNATARLTLVDYAEGVFDADEEAIPAFDSQITLPPRLMRARIGTDARPIVTLVQADEAALVRSTAGSLQVGIRVSFRAQATLPEGVTHVQAQYAVSSGAVLQWRPVDPVPLAARTLWIGPVRQGSTYAVRLRYMDVQGYTGAWRRVTPDVVVTGRSNPPNDVTGLTLLYDDKLGLTLDWEDCPDIDFKNYQVRRATGAGLLAADWDAAAGVKTVTDSFYRLGFLPPGPAYTYFVKARDLTANWSASAATITVDVDAPTIAAHAVPYRIIANGVRLRWVTTPGTFPVVNYEIRVGGTNWETAELVGHSQTTNFTTFETGKGNYVYRIKAIDAAGNYSNGIIYSVRVDNPVNYAVRVVWSGVLR